MSARILGEEVLAEEYRDEMKARRWKTLFEGCMLPAKIMDKYNDLANTGPGGVITRGNETRLINRAISRVLRP